MNREDMKKKTIPLICFIILLIVGGGLIISYIFNNNNKQLTNSTVVETTGQNGISDDTNVVFPAFETSALENRQSFNSAEEMKSSIVGTWKFEEGDTIYYYVINENEVETIVSIPNGKDPIVTKSTEIEWNPEQGSLISDLGNDEKTVVSIDKGAISLQNGKFYKTTETPYRKRIKSGFSSNSTQSNSTQSKSTQSYSLTDIFTEKAENVLKLSIKLTSNSTYMIIEGSVTNKGSLTYDYVKIRGMFLDENGNVIDTAWTYAVGSEHLRPGESSTFSMSTKKNSKIKKARVEILDYEISK